MDPSAKSFFQKCVHSYPKAKCHTCKYRANRAMLVSFRFFRRNGTPSYDIWFTELESTPPKDRFSIQDGHLVCQRCCGFKQRATEKMEGHLYTWFDGTMSYCPEGQFSNKVKTLCESVLEGEFTRETLQRVMKYQHDSWEHPLNQFIRKHAADWEKVKEFAKKLQHTHNERKI